MKTMKTAFNIAAATLIITGAIVAGAEVTNPAWWPWANLAGAPLMLSGLGLYRLLQRGRVNGI